MNMMAKTEAPTLLDITDIFAGDKRAYGMFEDRMGKVKTSFVVDMHGYFLDDIFHLEEDFLYANGDQEHHVWTIKRKGNGRFEGERSGIVGIAQGQAHQGAFNWRYNMDLPLGKRTIRLKFDDWMYHMHDGILVNRARVTKFGLYVGSVTITFR